MSTKANKKPGADEDLSPEELVKYTSKMPFGNWKALHVHALGQRRSFQDVLNQAADDYCKKHGLETGIPKGAE